MVLLTLGWPVSVLLGVCTAWSSTFHCFRQVSRQLPFCIINYYLYVINYYTYFRSALKDPLVLLPFNLDMPSFFPPSLPPPPSPHRIPSRVLLVSPSWM